MKHLTVEVKCHEVHEGIHRILDLLRSYGVPFEQIKIQPAPQLIMLDRNEEGPWPSASKLTLDNFSVLVFLLSAFVCVNYINKKEYIRLISM